MYTFLYSGKLYELKNSHETKDSEHIAKDPIKTIGSLVLVKTLINFSFPNNRQLDCALGVVTTSRCMCVQTKVVQQ